MAHDDAELWTVAEAAEYLRIPVSSVYKMTSGKSKTPIPHIKLGGRVRFRQRDIDAWLDLWAVEPTTALATAKARALRARR